MFPSVDRHAFMKAVASGDWSFRDNVPQHSTLFLRICHRSILPSLPPLYHGDTSRGVIRTIATAGYGSVSSSSGFSMVTICSETKSGLPARG